MLLTLVMFRRKSERQGSIRVTGVCMPENTLTAGVFVYFYYAFEIHYTFIFKMHFYPFKVKFWFGSVVCLNLNVCNSSDARLNCICVHFVLLYYCYIYIFYYSLCDLDVRNTHSKYNVEAFKTGLGLMSAPPPP